MAKLTVSGLDGLEDKMRKAALDAAHKKVASGNFDVKCPHCNSQVNIPAGKSACPRCKKVIDLKLDMDF